MKSIKNELKITVHAYKKVGHSPMPHKKYHQNNTKTVPRWTIDPFVTHKLP